MLKSLLKTGFAITLLVGLTVACQKDKAPEVNDTVDYFAPTRVDKPNALDSLIDTLHTKYKIRVIYKFEPRVIDPSTFFTPPEYSKARDYVKVVLEQLWLAPLSKAFPDFFMDETPLEFLLIGGGVHFNSITSANAAGAGLNGQFYRLGMGNVDGYNRTREWLRDHISILYHEHAHQLDHKYGRPKGYDQVSQGDYYFLSYWQVPDATAQKDGFFRNYGGFAREEDFATSVEAMIRYPKSTIDSIISWNPKLQTKYKMVYNFYKSRGIDLHEMHEVIDSTVIQLVP